MNRRAILACFLLIPALATAQKKQAKPPEIEVSEAAVRREGGMVNIDGSLRNSGTRPIKGLRIFIYFRSTEGRVVATRQGGIDQEVLEPGDEAELHAQVPDEVRAVDVQFGFEDDSGRTLTAGSAGPFTIE
jgi:hypothetical protein